MTRRAAAILLGVLAVAVAGLLWFARPGTSSSSGRRRFRLFLRVTPAPAAAVSVATPNPGAPAATPAQTVRITLFFPAAEDGKLRSEERDIGKPPGGNAFLKALFAELKRGPQRPGLSASLPEKIQLRNAFLLPNGLAVLDLAVDSGLSFGSDEELTIVAALVDTTLQNVADTNRVRILVNGEPAETLGGHVDLTRPLLYLRNEVAP
jgi:germination protein M